MARARTRRRSRSDDPQGINHLKEELGLSRLYLDDWYGFNAAREMKARGTLDPESNPFLGLPANRLKYRDITADEQADNSTNSRVLAPDAVLNSHIGEQINNTKLPNIGGLQGDLPLEKLPGNIPDSKLGNIGKPKLPGDIVYGDGGKAHRGQIADFLNGDRLIKDETLPTSVLASRPWASKTDPGQVRRIARRVARDVIRDMVKATSLKGG
jgi:hypothetical protein